MSFSQQTRKGENRLDSPASCYLHLFQELIGDPMERATLQGVNWTLAHGDIVVSRNINLRIVHRHHFSSSLARMSTVVILEHAEGRPLMALVKGAPEVSGDNRLICK